MRFILILFVATTTSKFAFSDSWIIETVAGSGAEQNNGIHAPMKTNIGNPFGVEIGPDGGLYICEVSNHRILRLDLVSKHLKLVAGTGTKGYRGDGGPAQKADLNEPYEIRFAGNGDLYFVEMQNHVVRMIDAKSHTISTIAGSGKRGFGGDDGNALKAHLNRPHSIALDAHHLYIADIGNHRIRRVDLETGIITTVAGSEAKKLPDHGGAAFGQPVLGPRALFLKEDVLWVALREGHSIWKLHLHKDRWEHIAGSGRKGFSGDQFNAKNGTFNGPKGIAVDNEDHVFVVDTENQAIRMIDSDLRLDTIAGSGPKNRGYRGDGQNATLAWLNRPHGICVASDGTIYIGDSENHRVRSIRRQPSKTGG